MLLIGGATATGKSGLAIEVAKKLNGEIISADSMQIYKHMNIGTAKVTESEKEGIIHHLIDIIEPEFSFSVAQYSNMAKKAIKDIKLKNKVPIVVGGTGLYLNSLIYEYKLSAQDTALREKLNNKLEMYGKEYMYHKLSELDPLSAKNIHCNNTKRVLRALEVFMLTGSSIAEKTDKKQSLPHLMYANNLDRQVIYENINNRVDEMFDNGLVGELDFLVNEKKLTFDAQSMQAIGYKEFKGYYTSKDKTLQEVRDDIKKHTRNYAKRQITWLKSIPSCKWLELQENCYLVELISNEYSKYSANLEL